MSTSELDPHFQSLDNAQALALANYPGVYFLCKGATVVYVGKAKNIACRVAAHHAGKDFDTFMAMRVSEELLSAVEMRWIRLLKPKLNCRYYTVKVKGEPGRPKLGKKTVSIRLSEDVLALAKQAAAIGGNLSAHIEQAIKDRLKKDGIK